MTKISFKLTSGLNAISLNWPIKFSRIKVEKLRYITSVDYTGVLSIQWQGLDIHSYVDATKVFEYFFMLFVENSNNRCIFVTLYIPGTVLILTEKPRDCIR